MKKKFVFCILTFLWIAAGCSDSVDQTEEDPNIKEFETMLNDSFTGPSEELAEIYEQFKNEDVDDTVEAMKKLDAYHKDRYESYFKDEYLEEVMNKSMFFTIFQDKAYREGVNITAEDVQVERSETNDTAYDFSVNVNISESEKVLNVEGRINTDENSEISLIRYTSGREWLH